ncbi:bacteriohemerythrin [Neptuniibacter sp. SY11_33]|uniref:bacteriohemerythrin n=1 Tax=unclassified Neptuniibacter TaxID=2630693 RepID=UPI0039F68D37
MQVEVTDIPQVAVDFMNDDHAEAITLLNQLFDTLETGNDSEVDGALSGFYQHNAEHFAREEEQMIRINFPPYTCHKGEHERVLQEMRETQQQWQANHDRAELNSYLKDTVIPWFVNHINTMDTVTAMFISRHCA